MHLASTQGKLGHGKSRFGRVTWVALDVPGAGEVGPHLAILKLTNSGAGVAFVVRGELEYTIVVSHHHGISDGISTSKEPFLEISSR
jgi:hypothetical protein